MASTYACPRSHDNKVQVPKQLHSPLRAEVRSHRPQLVRHTETPECPGVIHAPMTETETLKKKYCFLVPRFPAIQPNLALT